MTLSEIVRDPRKFLKTFQDDIAYIKPDEVDIKEYEGVVDYIRYLVYGVE